MRFRMLLLLPLALLLALALAQTSFADTSLASSGASSCTNDPSSPYLSVAQLRSSFVCDHLEKATPLAELLCLTGIVEVESLIYYSRHVTGAPQSKAALRQALAQGG